jgi:ribosomal protein S27AE
MRLELRTRAAALLRAEPEKPAVAVVSTSHCTACGAQARPDDRFCGKCGARLGDAEESRA